MFCVGRGHAIAQISSTFVIILKLIYIVTHFCNICVPIEVLTVYITVPQVLLIPVLGKNSKIPVVNWTSIFIFFVFNEWIGKDPFWPSLIRMATETEFLNTFWYPLITFIYLTCLPWVEFYLRVMEARIMKKGLRMRSKGTMSTILRANLYLMTGLTTQQYI